MQNTRIFGATIRLQVVKVAIIGAGLCILTGVPATAQSSEDGQVNTSVKIKHSDLQTRSGIAQVHKKLARKARNACATRNRKTSDRPKATEICEVQLLDDFIRGVNNPDLTDYHEALAG